MFKSTFSILFTFCLLSLSFLTEAQMLNRHLGQVLIKTEKEIEEIIALYHQFEANATNFRLKKVISNDLKIYLLEFNHNVIHEERFLNALRKDTAIATVQFNHILKNRAIPNDPEFDNQWQYINTGQSAGLVGADIDMDLAWDIATGGVTALGDTIVAAIIDDGFDFNHQDFGDNLWVNHHEVPNDNIDNDNNGYVDDYKGWNAYSNNDDITGGYHGTPVTGIIGAKGNNGIGVSGVNWNVKLMIIQGGGDEAEALAAYAYCYKLRKTYNETNGEQGAYVVTTNSSWGVDLGQPADAPLWCNFYDTLGVQGIISCGATINGNQNVDEVGDLPTACSSNYLISVTNMNRQDQKVSAAGYGAATIDLGAFGDDTWTASFGNSYGGFGGTSGATPHVAGTVALMYSSDCPSFAAFAKSSPQESALLVKQYLLNAVDPNPSLVGITVTEGRLNAFKALSAMVDNCDPSGCFKPYNVSAANVTTNMATISWQEGGGSNDTNFRYRMVGAVDWIHLSSVSTPYILSNLEDCVNYEFQLQSLCDSDTTDWTNSFDLKTGGCCEAPSGIVILNINSDFVDVSWSNVLVAEGYQLRYKAANSSTWIDLNIHAEDTTLTNLMGCTSYELQINTDCPEDVLSDYSESVFFTTTNCGACIDHNYCNASGQDASLEWIETVSINTINQTSGSNNGYANFTNISTDIEQGQSYEMTITPGFLGAPYNEYIKVWIDYNQDGDFDDDHEMVFDPGVVTQVAISETIQIPINSELGSTRMRVAMRFQYAANPCDENFDYGEVEDYCINILPDPSPSCDMPININYTLVSENSTALSWDEANYATAYVIQYKETSTAVWLIDTTTETSITLIDLVPCADYEFRVQSICAFGESEFSTPTTFTNICTGVVSLYEDLNFEISPNPVSNQLNIQHESNRPWLFKIIDLNGKVLYQAISDSDNYYHSMYDYPAGVYFVELHSQYQKAIRKVVKY